MRDGWNNIIYILFIILLFELPEATVKWIQDTIAILAILLSSIIIIIIMQIFDENIEDNIFLLFIVFRGRFPYLKLISYILLSYSVFAISMLILRD